MKFRAPVVTAFSLLGNLQIKLFNRTKIRYFSPLRERERERAQRRKAARMGGESRRFADKRERRSLSAGKRAGAAVIT